jgi:hypothetical protein
LYHRRIFEGRAVYLWLWKLRRNSLIYLLIGFLLISVIPSVPSAPKLTIPVRHVFAASPIVQYSNTTGSGTSTGEITLSNVHVGDQLIGVATILSGNTYLTHPTCTDSQLNHYSVMVESQEGQSQASIICVATVVAGGTVGWTFEFNCFSCAGSVSGLLFETTGVNLSINSTGNCVGTSSCLIDPSQNYFAVWGSTGGSTCSAGSALTVILNYCASVISGYGSGSGSAGTLTTTDGIYGGLTVFAGFASEYPQTEVSVSYGFLKITSPYPSAPELTYTSMGVQYTIVLSLNPTVTMISVDSGSQFSFNQSMSDSSGRVWYSQEKCPCYWSSGQVSALILYNYNDQALTAQAMINQAVAFVRWLLPSLLILFCFLLLGAKANNGHPVSVPMLLLLEMFGFSIVGVLGWLMIGLFYPVWLSALGVVFCIIGMYFTREGSRS